MRDIVLPRNLDITAVTAVASELVEALAEGDITLDAGAIAKLDAAGLQLLCAAVTTARAAHAQVSWKAIPPLLADGARTLALTDALGLPRARAQENC